MAPERSYDKDTHAPGRSRDADAVAHEAAASMDTLKTNDEDPNNDFKRPRGNDDAPDFNRKRKIGE